MEAYKRCILDYYKFRERFAEADDQNVIDYARDEGRAEGIAEGRAEGKWEKTIQMVMNARKAGLPMESIAFIAGLTTEEVTNIISSQLS